MMVDRAAIMERLLELVGADSVEAAFFTTYTFGRSFFEDDVLNPLTEDGSLRGIIPVTVVVDRHRYAGSNYGYEVVRYPNAGRLWHPKNILLMVRDRRSGWLRTIFGIGSANLTRTGWEQNDELVSLQDWPGWKIPAVVSKWLRAPWLVHSQFAEWARVNASVRKKLPYRHMLLSSLDTPLWPQIPEYYRIKNWDEAHVVAPFHDQSDPDSDDMEGNQGHGGFLQQLCKMARSGRSKLHLYLASSSEEKGECCVAASKGALERVSKVVSLNLRMIKPRNKGLFHAKLTAVRVGTSWCIVTGSPNATSAAFVSECGNVEVALCRYHRGRSIPKSLLPASSPVSLNRLRSLPGVTREVIWDALDSAAYDVKRRKLTLAWRTGYNLGNTEIQFDGKVVDPGKFEPGDSQSRSLQTLPRKRTPKPVSPGTCPITWKDDVPDVGCTRLRAMTPNDWLEALGSVVTSPLTKEGVPGPSSGSSEKGEAGKSSSFDWAVRVKRLDASLASVTAQLGDIRSERILSLLLRDVIGAWKAHNPHARRISAAEKAWRMWVRAGLWQVLDRTRGKTSGVRRVRRQADALARTIPQKLKEYPIAPE